jgi:hypothetical protein
MILLYILKLNFKRSYLYRINNPTTLYNNCWFSSFTTMAGLTVRKICVTDTDTMEGTVCRSHNPVFLFSFMNYRRIYNMSNTTGIIRRTYPSPWSACHHPYFIVWWQAFPLKTMMVINICFSVFTFLFVIYFICDLFYFLAFFQ